MTFGALAAAAGSSNDVTPGVLGFLVVAAIGVALVFLLRSMNKQFRKITPKPEAPAGPEGTTDSTEATGPTGATGSEPGQSESPVRETPV